jgi:D-alanine-D-alanine ligase
VTIEPLNPETGIVPGTDGSENASRRPRVAVLFGGRSSEHSVSCVTAAGVLDAIDRNKYDVVPVGIARNGRWSLVSADPSTWSLRSQELPEVTVGAESVVLSADGTSSELVAHADGTLPRSLGRIDVVFPVLHGPFGEDGTLQGMLEMADIRYVGAGVLASAVGMDKHFMKVVFESAGLKVGPYEVITDRQWQKDASAALERAARLTFPLFVKPARGGSSMGITRVTDPSGLRAAVETAREHDPKVVVEAGITGREIEVAVLQGRGTDDPRTSHPGEIAVQHGGHEWYDFEAKYVDGTAAELPGRPAGGGLRAGPRPGGSRI